MGKLEMEMVQLSADDAEVFMKEYGIEELSLSKMIKLSYDHLAQAEFFDAIFLHKDFRIVRTELNHFHFEFAH